MKINHVLIQTQHLDQMTAFLTKATGMKVGYRPPFPFSGTWLYSGENALIHVVDVIPNHRQKDYLQQGEERMGVGAVDHVALEGDDYEALLSRLKKHRIAYTEHVVPESGERQVFVKGPDQIKFEFLFNSVAKSNQYAHSKLKNGAIS